MTDVSGDTRPETVHDRIEKIIESWVPDDGDLIAEVVAQKLYANLQETAPDLLEQWLHERAQIFLTQTVTSWLNRERAKASRRAVKRAFKDASDQAEEGDDTELGHFAVLHVVAADNTRRRVADMTGADHRFVADKYQASGKYDLMLSAFHRAIGKACGAKRTADVMTEQQYDEQMQSFAKRLAS